MKGLGKVHPVVVLFDEIEKAHPRILDKFLRVMITFYLPPMHDGATSHRHEER